MRLSRLDLRPNDRDDRRAWEGRDVAHRIAFLGVVLAPQRPRIAISAVSEDSGALGHRRRLQPVLGQVIFYADFYRVHLDSAVIDKVFAKMPVRKNNSVDEQL